ncbi:MAG: 50S ribosomal protein L11 methyltransferase [Myxococcales bacterium]|nr:50S ribosomal protein L11 methyltransferase [Myxococcales bacterium]
MEGQWWQWTCVCQPEQAEAFGGVLMEMGALGVEERAIDERLILQQYQGDMKLIAYFGEEPDATMLESVGEWAVQFGVDLETAAWSVHRDDGWSTNWRRFFHPLEISERLVIRPSWEPYDAKPNQVVLELDPGMAFGTGHHETTSQCLRLLEQHVKPGQSVLDVGCGSGILSIAAILLGAQHATGVDIDPDAIMVAKENAELNGTLEACTFSTTMIEDVEETAPIVLANIQAHILLPMQEALWAHTEAGGVLILSGLLNEQAEDVKTSFLQGGHTFLGQIQEETWSSLALQKSA